MKKIPSMQFWNEPKIVVMAGGKSTCQGHNRSSIVFYFFNYYAI